MQLNNIVLLTGRLVADPEIKTVERGSEPLSVVNFCIAVDRRSSKRGEEKQTDFLNCVAWNKRADFVAKWFKKGSLISVEGCMQSRRYEDKDGNKRTAYEVVCDEVGFVPGSKVSDNNANQTVSMATTVDEGHVDDGGEDLPF